MKILLINSVCGSGSTGRIVADLCRILEQRGHSSLVAYGRGYAPKDLKTIKIGSEISVKLHGLMTRTTDKHGFYSTWATKKLIKQIRKFDPDIIHLHNLHGYYLNIEVLFNYLKNCNKPVIWTLHDCWAFTGHCAHFDYIGCFKWKEQCFCCPQKKRYPASLVKDNSKWNYLKKRDLFGSMNNMAILTPSNWLAGLVGESFLKNYPTRVIYNGIDLTTFKPGFSNFRAKYPTSDKFIILGVSNVWDERKGLNDFIELSKIINQDMVIVLVGLKDNQIKKLPEGIISIRGTNNLKELVNIYRAADVFLNTSVEETFGLVAAEAMACGTPVISYDTTANPEIMDGKSGYIVERRNIEEVMNKIQQIKKNGKDSYGQDCINNVRDRFEKKHIYEGYINLYSETMNNMEKTNV